MDSSIAGLDRQLVMEHVVSELAWIMLVNRRCIELNKEVWIGGYKDLKE